MSVALGVGLESTNLVEVTEFPEENEQFLVELDFLCGVGKVGLEQGVRQQPGYPLEDELEVLGEQSRVPSSPAAYSLDTPANVSSLSPISHNLYQSPIEGLGLDITASTLESRASAFPPASLRIPSARLQLPVTPRWTHEPGSLDSLLTGTVLCPAPSTPILPPIAHEKYSPALTDLSFTGHPPPAGLCSTLIWGRGRLAQL